MRLSTLLLSSAALVASGTVGFAADLPSKKAAPVEYVRICSQFGTGFFFIPGSDTCMRVSGRIRADYIANEQFLRTDNTVAFRARGYVGLDSFTATDWGPVRATTRVFVTRDTAGQSVNTNNNGVTLEWAFIQFAGITAGKAAASFFDFAPQGGVSYNGGGNLGRGSDEGDVNVLAYTATIGGGFSATIALEDTAERRSLIGGGYANVNALGQYVNSTTVGGQAMPDVVGRLEYTGSWGIAALTGAIHQTRVGNGSTAGSVNLVPVTNTIKDTEYGFAIQGGVKVNLPMLAPGDAIFLQAAYADGANSYTGWSPAGVGSLGNAATTVTANSWFVPSSDVVFDANGNAKTTKSWSIAGGFLHFWAPTVRQGVTASYGAIDHFGSLYDAAAFTATTNLIWTPVRGLDIGAEVGYSRVVEKPNFWATIPLAGLGQSSDAWFGRLRFQRDF